MLNQSKTTRKIKRLLGSFLLLLIGLPAMAQQWNTSGSNIYNSNSGNVGIGTSVPGHKLEVQGGNIGLRASTSANDIGDIVFRGHDDYGTDQHARIWIPTGNIGRKLYLSSADLTPDIIIDANGHVGIGIVSPTEKFHVNGVMRATGYIGNGSSLTSLNMDNVGLGELSGSYIEYGNYMINATGVDGQVWTSNGNGRGRWESLPSTSGDNLGNHIVTQNIRLDTFWLSGDGGNEGISVSSGGKVGIGTASPTVRFEVNGVAKATEFRGSGLHLTGLNGNNISSGKVGKTYIRDGQFMINAEGIPGQVWTSDGDDEGYWANPSTGSDSPWDISGSYVYYNDGNIGIGTSEPSSKLEVKGGDIELSATPTNGNDIGDLVFRNKDDEQYGRIWTQSGASSGRLYLTSGRRDEGEGLVSIPDITIDDDGEVGIGILDPTEKLQVAGTVKADDFEGAYAKYGNYGYISAQNPDGFINIAANAWNTGASWEFNGSGSVFQPDILGNFRFYKHSGDTNSFKLQMILDPNGNLGLGTSEPTSKLEVHGGDMKLKSISTNPNDIGDLIFHREDDVQYGRIWTSTSAVRRLYLSSADNTADIVIDEQGEVGIGTLAPTEELEVIGTVKATNFTGNGAELTNLSAANIDSGIIAAAHIPDLTASKIISGTFLPERIPHNVYMITSAGTAGQVWTSEGGGKGKWKNPSELSGAGLGDHIATENIHLNGHWLSGDGGNEGLQVDANGNVGVGVATPSEKLELSGAIRIANSMGTTPGTIRWTGTDFEGHDGTEWKSFTQGGAGSSSSLWSASGSAISFVTGNVGIGTTNPQYALDVSGTIRACEVEVNDLDGWCDYVFEDDYKLPSLKEVKSYIKTNKHLQDIPSEAEVMAHGVSLNDMTKGLLKKVEELTLYMIEKDEQVEALLKRIEELEKN